MARYIANPAACNTQIVALGVDAYLKMLLHDNFVHTDLHPGNILVRERVPRHAGPRHAPPQQTAAPPQQKQQLQLVLLDFGLAEELNPTVRRHFISLLHMIGKGECTLPCLRGRWTQIGAACAPLGDPIHRLGSCWSCGVASNAHQGQYRPKQVNDV